MPQPTSRPYVLGVDGGGTKTHAAIADRQGHVVGTGSGGPVNIGWVGAAVAAESTQAAIRGALEAAGVGADAVAFAYLGMASVDLDRPEDKSRPVFAAALEALGLPADRTQIDNDAVVGMAAALGPGPGACVVGGTGFNAIAVARDGSRVRVPWYVGARAAGHILGRQAAMAAFFDLIGAGPHTGLTPRVLAALKIGDACATPHAAGRRGPGTGDPTHRRAGNLRRIGPIGHRLGFRRAVSSGRPRLTAAASSPPLGPFIRVDD